MSKTPISDLRRRLLEDMAVRNFVERLPPNEGAEKLSDLNMMVNAGGRERSQEEFARLLQETGFELRTVLGLAGPLAPLVAT